MKNAYCDPSLGIIDEMNDRFRAFFVSCGGLNLNYSVGVYCMKKEISPEKEASFVRIDNCREEIEWGLLNMFDYGCGLYNIVSKDAVTSASQVGGNPVLEVVRWMSDDIIQTLNSFHTVMYEYTKESEAALDLKIEDRWFADNDVAIFHFTELKDIWGVLNTCWTD